MMTFNPRRLIALRIAAGFSSQVALAAALGVTQQAVSSWESGLWTPSGAMMLPLTRVLGCRLEDFYGPDPAPEDHDTTTLSSVFQSSIETI